MGAGPVLLPGRVLLSVGRQAVANARLCEEITGTGWLGFELVAEVRHVDANVVGLFRCGSAPIPREAPLVVLTSPYWSLLRPLLHHIDHVQSRGDDPMVAIVLPEFLPRKWWQHVLHNKTALLIKGALLFRKKRRPGVSMRMCEPWSMGYNRRRWTATWPQ